MSTLLCGESNLTIQRIYCRNRKNEIHKLWLDIQSESNSSYFLSWGWLSIWLDNIPNSSNVDLVLIRINEVPRCFFFLGVHSSLQYFLFHKTRGYINETGSSGLDELIIEYNSVLGDISKPIWRKLLSDPLFSDIDEFHLNNITRRAYKELEIGDEFRRKIDDCKPCYYVDLAALREAERSYLECVSSNKRAQIRKSISYFEKDEAISIQAATNSSEAQDFLDALISLHQEQWTARGHPGAFVGREFVNFHRQLIKERFDTGELQLLRIGNSKFDIGFLYNFIYENCVYYYQSGFRYETNNSARPGIVCHYTAIEYNLSAGRDVYNFLAGESQYKRSLSTDSDQLHTVVLVRDNLKWKLEKILRGVRGVLQGKKANSE